MKMMEKFSGVFLIAGLFLFIVAFFTLALVPVTMIEKIPSTSELPHKTPADFLDVYETPVAYREALVLGRNLYIREACWHCHSQFVRPLGDELLRYGPVSNASELQNVLQLPQLLGTRRVGPDLSRVGGKYTNDWHYAHLFQPTAVVPQSVMPSYAWYFELKDGVPTPKKEAKAMVAYLQWLGSGWKEIQEEGDYETASLPPGN